ncbi:uncharacterized protein LOC121972589 [Zingiber officinale]|uniref:uncharacterized protein LOC121972589 n=1 Tax=Zingiber officinale TaxID=94328 RepID=UPI001C4D1839|nr:uncharacterized protein LOC121972589 [Zingiber officinale]
MGITSFHLVYGGEAVVTIEVGVEFDRIQLYDKENVDQRLMELDLVEEIGDMVAAQLMVYRQRMKQSYNQTVIPRSFQLSDLVWKKVKPVRDVSKLEPPWSGPYKVMQ